MWALNLFEGTKVSWKQNSIYSTVGENYKKREREEMKMEKEREEMKRESDGEMERERR